jgi:hypothetical protein
MVVTITFTDDRSIWLFAVLSALAAGGWVGAAGLMRVFAVLLVRHRRGQEAAAAGAAAESESPRLPLGHQPATRHGDLG